MFKTTSLDSVLIRRVLRITAETEAAAGLVIRYSVLAERTEHGMEYGVAVVSAASGERVHIRRVTTNESMIRELLALLARNGVTPVTARDVVYDWLC